MWFGLVDHPPRWLRSRAGIAVTATLLFVAITGAVALPERTHGGTADALPPPTFVAIASMSTSARPVALRREQAVVPATLSLADDALRAPAEPAVSADEPPEARLIAVYRALADGRLDAALATSSALVHDHPNFRLAQLVHADLLTARAAPLADFGGSVPQISRQDDSGLVALKQEALLRLRALSEAPPPDAVPAEFVRLPQTIPYAIAVDTSRSRLYLFENRPDGARLAAHFYVSIGKQGADKSLEGDQRTPLGVYFVTDHLGANLLEDRFGVGALPLNYPNAYDKSRGRTGSGILLHGVPADIYARPPLDSDGCVVLANDDLQSLARILPQRDTPVVITRQIRWTRKAEQVATDKTFLAVVRDWQEARLRSDRTALSSFYATKAPEAAVPGREPSRKADDAIRRIEDWSVIGWGEAPEVRVVTYRELAGKRDKQGRLMRQYWTQTAGRWAILSESQVR